MATMMTQNDHNMRGERTMQKPAAQACLTVDLIG
jgi:hypothetical protein